MPPVTSTLLLDRHWLVVLEGGAAAEHRGVLAVHPHVAEAVEGPRRLTPHDRMNPEMHLLDEAMLDQVEGELAAAVAKSALQNRVMMR